MPFNVLLRTLEYTGTRIIAPTISAKKLIESITVKTASRPVALNTHIINIVSTVLVSIPKAPAMLKGKTSLTKGLFDDVQSLLTKR